MSAKQPDTIYHVIDNRVLLLGLDSKYREYMRDLEAEFLLPQVEALATKLGVNEATVPIEGYYSEHPTLTRYFKLMRALQGVSESSEKLVHNMPEFQNIWKVANSPIFGKPIRNGNLLPGGRDPLSEALHDTKEIGWEVQKIVNRGYEIVKEIDDISLVGLAIRLKDPIVIAALRESVILYAETVELGYYQGPKIEYVWKVDAEFAKTVNRFIKEFNSLLPRNSYLRGGIRKAEPTEADYFYSAFSRNDFLGRCANIGYDRSSPRRFYHWAITQQNNELALDEFWDTELWTTQNYRSRQEQLGWKFLRDELRNIT